MNAAQPIADSSRQASGRRAVSHTLELLALAAVDGLGDDGVARVLKQVRMNGKDLEDFYASDLLRLQSHYGLKRAAAESVKDQASRLRAGASDLLERARGLGIVVLAPGDPGYPLGLEEFYDGQPPLLYARGSLPLLESPTVAFVSSSGTSSQSLTNALGLASRLAEAGCTLVTGTQNPTYNVVALSGKRAAGDLVVVLHEGLLTAIGDAPEREPVPLARQADDAFDAKRTLLLSPFRLDGRWQKGNGPRRDSLMVALAKTVIAMEIRPGGVVESLCRDAVARKRRVFVCQQCEAAGRNLANEAVLDVGAFPLVPDAVGSNCDLVLKPHLPTTLSPMLGTNDLERRRELGQFFTPPLVARFMWDMLEIIHGKHFPRNTRAIDPASGDGVILRAAIERARLPAGNLFGVEIDETLVPLWRQDALLRRARFYRTNGLVDNTAIGVVEGAFDVVAGNPPFGGRGLTDLLRLLEVSPRASPQNLDLFGESTLREAAAPRGQPLPGHARAVLDALARALSRYACWRLGTDAEEEEQSLAESDNAPGDLFSGLGLCSERRVVAGDYERMAQLVANWPPDRLLDTSRPDVRDTLRRLARTAIEVFFTERFLRLTKPGGLVAVIVPESIVASDRVGPFRKWLSGQMDLLAVVSLPHKVFTGVGANAKTSILFAQRLLEPRPARWDPSTMLEDPLESGKVVWLAAPELDAPGWNLEWYLETVLENARQHYSGARQKAK